MQMQSLPNGFLDPWVQSYCAETEAQLGWESFFIANLTSVRLVRYLTITKTMWGSFTKVSFLLIF